MKAAKRIATVLRILGWVMVAVAVGVTIYALATSGGVWTTLKGWMNSMGVQQTFLDRVTFDHQFYNAMIDAADTTNMQESLRVDGVRASLSDWEDKFDEALRKGLAELTEEFYQAQESMSKEDAAAFLELYQQMESGEETRLLKEAFEYLDGIAKPAAGKGKLAKLQAASVEPDVKAAYDGGFRRERLCEKPGRNPVLFCAGGYPGPGEGTDRGRAGSLRRCHGKNRRRGKGGCAELL